MRALVSPVLLSHTISVANQNVAFFFLTHYHIFLSSWHLIWRWQTRRCTILWQICKPWIDLCSTHSNMQAWYLATYHKSHFYFFAHRISGSCVAVWRWMGVSFSLSSIASSNLWIRYNTCELWCLLFAWVVLCWELQ